MAIIDLFSIRQKALRGEAPDVYKYDQIPETLRVQIVQIWEGVIGDRTAYFNDFHQRHRDVIGNYQVLVNILRHEYGVFRLPGADAPYGRDNYLAEFVEFFLNTKDAEQALDAIELSCRFMERIVNRQTGQRAVDDAVSELNVRFRQHGIGYEYADGELIRIDSQLLHAAAVKPALALLKTTEQYAGAQAEFLTAYESYRHGRNKEAITEALKALESVMKAICTKRKWAFDATAQARGLIDVMFANNLIPSFLTSHFSALRSTLESGVPTMRNKLPAAHGQGVAVVNVPEYLVAYMLHLSASAIVLLTEAERAMQ